MTYDFDAIDIAVDLTKLITEHDHCLACFRASAADDDKKRLLVFAQHAYERTMPEFAEALGRVVPLKRDS